MFIDCSIQLILYAYCLIDHKHLNPWYRPVISADIFSPKVVKKSRFFHGLPTGWVWVLWIKTTRKNCMSFCVVARQLVEFQNWLGIVNWIITSSPFIYYYYRFTIIIDQFFYRSHPNPIEANQLTKISKRKVRPTSAGEIYNESVTFCYCIFCRLLREKAMLS